MFYIYWNYIDNDPALMIYYYEENNYQNFDIYQIEESGIFLFVNLFSKEIVLKRKIFKNIFPLLTTVQYLGYVIDD